jgi:hypothetical protein
MSQPAFFFTFEKIEHGPFYSGLSLLRGIQRATPWNEYDLAYLFNPSVLASLLEPQTFSLYEDGNLIEVTIHCRNV